MQQTNLGNTSVCFENYLGRLPSVGIDGESVPIDSLTLAKLDIALFRCLRKIGSSRERICSALVDLHLKLTQDLHLILTHPERQIMA